MDIFFCSRLNTFFWKAVVSLFLRQLVIALIAVTLVYFFMDWRNFLGNGPFCWVSQHFQAKQQHITALLLHNYIVFMILQPLKEDICHYAMLLTMKKIMYKSSMIWNSEPLHYLTMLKNNWRETTFEIVSLTGKTTTKVEQKMR